MQHEHMEPIVTDFGRNLASRLKVSQSGRRLLSSFIDRWLIYAHLYVLRSKLEIWKAKPDWQ
jgi:hypothetical protein